MSVKNEFNTLKKLILHVLEHYPETRNSDNKLYLQCAKELGAKTLDDLERIDVNIITLHKLRQKIQNKENLFPATKEVKQVRTERQKQIKEWMVS